MFDMFQNLSIGFYGAATIQNIAFCFLGCVLGTLIGVLPGLGVVSTIAMLLPLTFGLDPLTALIMLAGIYYGAQYGGSTTSILINMPGEVSSIVTTLDGHPMAKQGRAGSALATAALASFFAGCVGTLFLAAFGPVMGSLSRQFNSPEYFSLMTLGLVGAIVIAQGSILKALAMMFLGLLLGLVGMDINTGVVRYSLGLPELWEALPFLPLAMGLFGLVEILSNLERPSEGRKIIQSSISRIWPTREDFKQAWAAVLRGTGIGVILGVLPGGGALLSSFASYTTEKRIAKDPSRFGKGAIEGVAGPEAANNAGAQTSFIPLLALGIPSNVVMAMMMGAMIIQGISPGTAVMTSRPDLFWGMIASMWIGNLMLVVINLPMIGLWVKLLLIPYRILFPIILVVALIGIYSINGSSFDIYLAGFFTLVGYLLFRLGCEPAPLLLGYVLGPLFEENLRRSLVLSRGDPMIFLSRPISLTLILMTVAVVLLIVLPQFRRTREVAFEE